MPIMARKKRRKSQGTDPTPQRRHGEATYKRRARKNFRRACIKEMEIALRRDRPLPCQIREKLARFNLEGQASVIVWAAEPEA